MASTMRNLARGLIPPAFQEKSEVHQEVSVEPNPTPPVEASVSETETPLISDDSPVSVEIEEVINAPPAVDVPHDVPVVEKKQEKKSKPKPAAKKAEKVTDQKKVNPPPPETEI